MKTVCKCITPTDNSRWIYTCLGDNYILIYMGFEIQLTLFLVYMYMHVAPPFTCMWPSILACDLPVLACVMYIPVHACMSLYMHVCPCTCTHVPVHVRACPCTCMSLYMHACPCTCMSLYMHACPSTCMYVGCICIYSPRLEMLDLCERELADLLSSASKEYTLSACRKNITQ